MKTLFYPRLAWDGLRKNRRMVFPYILTCICMISMFYILRFLGADQTAALFPRGGSQMSIIMALGSGVIAVFSLIFLFYTYSFLIRRRAAEFGLYNVLGMGKRNLARILTFESLITSGISIFGGLFIGIALSKLAELALVNMLHGTVNYALRVEISAVKATIGIYLVIFVLLWISSVIRVGSSTAVNLLKSEKAGEKPPKANWFLGLLGIIILGIAYYIALVISNPIGALTWFFLAVILVIIATYLLMIAGSVLLCRILQKNKNYYYKAQHFVSVSSMVYRMKRNGAGLASIAVIATMVLVMISSTSCLWFGTGDMMDTRYPAEVNFQTRFAEGRQLEPENLDAFRETIRQFNEEAGVKASAVLDIAYAIGDGLAKGDVIDLGEDELALMQSEKVRDLYMISLETYNRLMESDLTLSPGEALVFTSDCSFDYETITLTCGETASTYRIVGPVKAAPPVMKNLKNVIAHLVLVVPDLSEALEEFSGYTTDSGRSAFQFAWKYCEDVSGYPEGNQAYGNAVEARIGETLEGRYEWMYFEEKEYNVVEFMTLNGGFLCIGIMLSIVFTLAAVLIIYYKQISEGYEDCKRFSVMRKVGMTKKEIRRSINSQLLVVFFIPLIFAGVHLIFAFPIISKLLIIFGLYNTWFFMMTTLISFVVFAIFYAIVYKVTSNVYYNIVSDAQ